MVLMGLQQDELTQRGPEVRIHVGWSLANLQRTVQESIDGTAVAGIATLDDEIQEYL